jgi:DNA mismatch endonuclease (patch repair protein)
MPKSNIEYWREKFAANVRRDREHEVALNALGWKTLTVWTCELRDPDSLQKKLRDQIL